MKKHDGKTEDNIVTKGLHDGKYNSQKLNFKQPNVLMFFNICVVCVKAMCEKQYEKA